MWSFSIFQLANRIILLLVQDDHLENSRKVPLDRHDIIIDKVTTSHDNNHIVAVTSNNMVSINVNSWYTVNVLILNQAGNVEGRNLFVRRYSVGN
mgnify:FL=1